ncbi:hypothetical protein [Clostridium sp. AWRP]|uniref:hypothetical protein n=1 Tax=Clostridium sp. AWRP TaxID=2212991 RepID=UPI000FD7C821|nr:hypothetical protein [Clostridium sp. AWRP]AZV56084.1 hypothetical protein DMR38_05430 [Clostridium sp. AWRP]
MFDILGIKYGDLEYQKDGIHGKYYYFEVNNLGANFEFYPSLSIPILCKQNVKTLSGDEVYRSLRCYSPTGTAMVDMAVFCTYPSSWLPDNEIEAYSDNGTMGTFVDAYNGNVYTRNSDPGELNYPNLWLSPYGCDTSTELTLLQQLEIIRKFIPYYSNTKNKYFMSGNLASNTGGKCSFEVPDSAIKGYSSISNTACKAGDDIVTINGKKYDLYKSKYDYISNLFDKYGTWYSNENNVGSCGSYSVDSNGKITSPIYVLEYKIIKKPAFSGVLDDIKKSIGISTPNYNNGILLNKSIHTLWINIKLFIVNWYEYMGKSDEFIKSAATTILLDKDCYNYDLNPTVSITADEKEQIETLIKNDRIQNGKYRYFSKKEYNSVIEHINNITVSTLSKIDVDMTALSSKHFQNIIDVINAFIKNYKYDFRIYYRNRSNAEGDIPGDKHCIEFKAGDDSKVSYTNKQVDVPYTKLY